MEVEYSFSALFLTLLFMLILLKLGRRLRSNNSISHHLPPGPWKLPLIGNIHQLVGSLPHCALRDLAKKYGPLMHLQVGEVSTVVVSSPDTVKEMMKTHDIIFASRPQMISTKVLSYNSTNIAFSPYGEYWKQLRKICLLELFSKSRVRSFQYIRLEETSKLIRWVASNAGSPINLTQKIQSYTSAVISRAAFGKISAEQDRFLYILQESLKLERLHKQLDGILDNIINEHIIAGFATRTDDPEGHQDFVEVLLKYHESENLEFSLTRENIKAVILNMFGAGVETSATTLDWAMVELMRNPTILKKAQEEVRDVFSSKGYVDEELLDELKYLKSVVNETLRLHPPVLLIPRLNSERCEIGGYEIPEKTKFMVNAWAIHRDPAYWEDAECFKPERFLDSSIDYKGTDFKYIPFGAGRRICPGLDFGLINVEFPLAKFLYHFDWTLPSETKKEEGDMIEASGFTGWKKDDLYVIPVLRNLLSVQ